MKGQKRTRKDYAHGLPVFSVDDPREAARIIGEVADLHWIGGGPAFVFPGLNGDIKNMSKATEALAEMYRICYAKETDLS